MQQFAFSFIPATAPTPEVHVLSRIGKCLSCKKVSRRDYTATRTETVGHGMFRRETAIYGREVNGGFLRASLDCQCPRCGAREWHAKRLEGRFNAGVKCNARCQGATGHDCECQCGGANHGRGFICE